MDKTLLCCVDIFHPPFGDFLPTGGGGKSLYALLSRLKNEMKVFVICFNKAVPEGRYSHKGISLRNVHYPQVKKMGILTEWLRHRKEAEILSELVTEIKPDLILAQRCSIPAAVTEGSRKGIPTVALVISYENILSSNEIMPRMAKSDKSSSTIAKNSIRLGRDLLELPIASNLKRKNHKAIVLTDEVVVPSDYMAGVIRNLFRRKAKVIYPLIKLTTLGEVTGNRNCITFLGGNQAKGIDIFIEVARSLPDKDFICGGRLPKGYEEIVGDLQNVDYTGWIGDVSSIYDRTRVLIAPVLWPEPFGMIAVEAMANGIPCIVSRKGGLPEAVGDAGIVVEDPFDIGAWVQEIKRLDDEETCKKLALKSLERSKYFDIESQYQKYREIFFRLIEEYR